jgi:hypothetical protein
LTEKEEVEDLVEQYEANLSNATSLPIRIMEIVNNEKYNDDKYKQKVLKRISDATDEFKSFLDEERDSGNVNLDPEASLFSHNVFSPRYRKRRIENHGRIFE